MGNENGEAHSFDLFGTPSYDPLGNQPWFALGLSELNFV
jgi:hypothetical protein